MSMANRGKLRRKMVLPVTVFRGQGEAKQLAHTLDVTETSARLGGLRMQLEPGEIIEIQRGGIKAKFQVYWMGVPGTQLEGQAGVRGLDQGKSIWSTHLPADQPDIAVDAPNLRQGGGQNHATIDSRADQSGISRYVCSFGATILAPGSNYPFRVQIKTIHPSGVDVESITTLPVNTVVSLEAKFEGIQLETAGVVTGSTHRVGMEIGFHKVTPEIHRKIVQVLQKLRQKVWDEQQVPTLPAIVAAGPSLAAPAQKAAPAFGRTDPFRELAALSQVIRTNWDYWKSTRTAAEIEELRKTVAELEELLSPALVDLHEYLAAGAPKRSGRA
ncbi:MAG TPA: hypothetical protein VFQ41_16505 [Candidatus Angelobacter sp.]|nr:hypothetical protein [Candidatus Angelobacter sp.]